MSKVLSHMVKSLHLFATLLGRLTAGTPEPMSRMDKLPDAQTPDNGPVKKDQSAAPMLQSLLVSQSQSSDQSSMAIESALKADASALGQESEDLVVQNKSSSSSAGSGAASQTRVRQSTFDTKQHLQEKSGKVNAAFVDTKYKVTKAVTPTKKLVDVVHSHGPPRDPPSLDPVRIEKWIERWIGKDDYLLDTPMFVDERRILASLPNEWVSQWLFEELVSACHEREIVPREPDANMLMKNEESTGGLHSTTAARLKELVSANVAGSEVADLNLWKPWLIENAPIRPKLTELFKLLRQFGLYCSTLDLDSVGDQEPLINALEHTFVLVTKMNRQVKDTDFVAALEVAKREHHEQKLAQVKFKIRMQLKAAVWPKKCSWPVDFHPRQSDKVMPGSLTRFP